MAGFSIHDSSHINMSHPWGAYVQHRGALEGHAQRDQANLELVISQSFLSHSLGLSCPGRPSEETEVPAQRGGTWRGSGGSNTEMQGSPGADLGWRAQAVYLPVPLQTPKQALNGQTDVSSLQVSKSDVWLSTTPPPKSGVPDPSQAFCQHLLTQTPAEAAVCWALGVCRWAG